MSTTFTEKPSGPQADVRAMLREVYDYGAHYDNKDVLRTVMGRMYPKFAAALQQTDVTELEHRVPQNPGVLNPKYAIHYEYFTATRKINPSAIEIAQAMFPELTEEECSQLLQSAANIDPMLRDLNNVISNDIEISMSATRKSMIAALKHSYNSVQALKAEARPKYFVAPELVLPGNLEVDVELLLPRNVTEFSLLQAVHFAENTDSELMPQGYEVKIPKALQSSGLRPTIILKEGQSIRPEGLQGPQIVEATAAHKDQKHITRLAELYGTLKAAFDTVSEEQSLDAGRADFIKLDGPESFWEELDVAAKAAGITAIEMRRNIVQWDGKKPVTGDKRLKERFESFRGEQSLPSGSYLDTKEVLRRLEILRERIEERANQISAEYHVFIRADNSALYSPEMLKPAYDILLDRDRRYQERWEELGGTTNINVFRKRRLEEKRAAQYKAALKAA